MTTKSKWFYPLQKEIGEYLHKNSKSHTCNWQDVCKTRVHENYTVFLEDGTVDIVNFIMYKHPSKCYWFMFKQTDNL